MPQFPNLGNLKQVADMPDWWMSDPVAVPFCSDRRLPFTMMLGNSKNLAAADVMAAVRAFLALTDQDRLATSQRVFRHYRSFVNHVPEAELSITEPEQIWVHIRPTDVFVSRHTDGDGRVYVRVCCDCDWDEEHGLQLVFRDGNMLTLVSAHEDGAFFDPE
jgi:hypothetical protein